MVRLTSPEKCLRLVRKVLVLPGSLKRLKTFLQKVTKCKDQVNSIPKITEGDKLPKITNYLVESLNSRDSQVMGQVTTGVNASVASGASASLPGWWEDAMDLDLEKWKEWRPWCFQTQKKGRKMPCWSLTEKRKIFIKKDCKSPIYRPYDLTSPLSLQILKRRQG